MFVLSFVDYRIYKGRLANIGIVLALVLLVLVFVPGLGVTRNEATRWLNIGVQFQPSEVMKVAVIIFLAAQLSKHPDAMHHLIKGV